MKAMHWLLLAAVLAGCFAFVHEVAAGGFKKGQEATLSFHSFDGGGPSYDVELGSDIVSYACKRKYARADHDRLCGAGYDVIYTFRGVRSGQTTMKVKWAGFTEVARQRNIVVYGGCISYWLLTISRWLTIATRHQ